MVTLVPTPAMKLELARAGFHSLEVVARGVDTARFDPARRDAALRRAWGAGDDDPVVIYVGRLAPEKNLSVVVRAFRAMRARAPAARLVFVGDGPSRDALARECPDAIFAGMRSGDDLGAHYASGDVFLFPSLTETFGNVTLEAMASGLAIVAYRHAAAAEIVTCGENGLLADYDDASGFVRLAEDLVADRPRVRRLGEQARLCALRFSWSAQVERLESVLCAVADAPPVRRARSRAPQASPST
jgi:glycosyltransferase involved in cell wall biosynthesis